MLLMWENVGEAADGRDEVVGDESQRLSQPAKPQTQIFI